MNHHHPATEHRRLPWLTILVLGAIGLVRPVLRISGLVDEAGPVSPSLGVPVATVIITLVWVLVVLWRREPRPFLTLVCAGLSYAVLSMVLSGILSPVLDGELSGPLANPVAIPMVLLTNAVWGAIAGGIAVLVRSVLKPGTK